MERHSVFRELWINAGWLLKIRSLTQAGAVVAALAAGAAHVHAANSVNDATSLDIAIINMRSGTDTTTNVTANFPLATGPTSLQPSVGVLTGSVDGGSFAINADTAAYVFRAVVGNGQTYGLSITNLTITDSSGNDANAILKIGQGTLTLTGDNTFDASTLTNAIQISGGALSIATDSNLGNTGNDLAMDGSINNATFAVTGATTLAAGRTFTLTNACPFNIAAAVTCDSMIAGTGSLTKTGAGTLTLTNNANNFGGSVLVTNGTLANGANSVIPNSATVTVNGANAVYDLGDFDDIVAGLSLVSGSVTGTNLSVLFSLSTFDVQDGSISAVLQGVSGLNKTTSGTVTLSAANTYSGTTTISGGYLVVNGMIDSSPVIVNGGVLQGMGTVGATTVNSGVVDPGAASNSVGTLTVDGSFTTGAAGVLNVDTDGVTNDLLVADTAILSGNGAVFVHELSGATALVEGQHYTFLQTTSGVTGQFASVSDDLPMIDILLGYELDSVYFYFVSSSTNYAAVANTPNELSVANYLDQTAPTASGDYQTVIDNLNLLNADQMRLAFNQMGGESFGTAGQTTINTTTLSLQQVGNHLSSLSMFGAQGGGPTTNLMAQVSSTSNAATSPNNIQLVSHSEAVEPEAKKAESSCLVCDACDNEKLWNGWSVGYGLGGSAQGGGGVSGATYGVGGFLAGVDRWVDDSTLVGVFGGYLGSGFSTGTPSAKVHDNAGQGGLYAMRRGDVLYVSGLIGGQSDQYTSHRNINFGAINRTATGNYDGWQGFGYSEIGANLSVPGWHRHSCLCQSKLTLQPYGALQYIHLRQNSISETGAGSLNLFSGGMDTDSLRSFLGTRLRYDRQGEGNLRRFIPELQASWLHEYIDASTALTARFGAVGGNGFIANGLNVGRDWALLGAGLTYIVTENIRLTANYYAQTNDRQTYHVGAGGLSVQW